MQDLRYPTNINCEIPMHLPVPTLTNSGHSCGPERRHTPGSRIAGAGLVWEALHV